MIGQDEWMELALLSWIACDVARQMYGDNLEPLELLTELVKDNDGVDAQHATICPCRTTS